jgi:hypothetical protein
VGTIATPALLSDRRRPPSRHHHSPATSAPDAPHASGSLVPTTTLVSCNTLLPLFKLSNSPAQALNTLHVPRYACTGRPDGPLHPAAGLDPLVPGARPQTRWSHGAQDNLFVVSALVLCYAGLSKLSIPDVRRLVHIREWWTKRTLSSDYLRLVALVILQIHPLKGNILPSQRYSPVQYQFSRTRHPLYHILHTNY